MKVLSIREPWASLIVNGYKCYEFRNWKTFYRGPILIHSSMLPEKENMKIFEKLGLDCKFGYIIGQAELTDCIEVTKEFEDELIRKNPLVYGASHGRGGYAWKLENIQKVENIKVKGKLGLWNYEN